MLGGDGMLVSLAELFSLQSGIPGMPSTPSSWWPPELLAHEGFLVLAAAVVIGICVRLLAGLLSAQAFFAQLHFYVLRGDHSLLRPYI